MLRSAFWIACRLLLLNPTFTVLAAEQQKTVLAIYSNRNDLAGNAIVETTLRSLLTLEAKPPVDLRSEYINNTSALSEDAHRALREFLRTKYAGEQIDVAVAVGEDAVRFVRDYGQTLFPHVPIVTWGSRELLRNWSNGPPVTGVLEPEGEDHMRDAVDFILKLQPQTRQLFIVSGASPRDRRRALIARDALSRYRDRITLTHLAGLPLDDLLQKLAHAPKNTAVLFLTMSEDGDGRTFMTSKVLEKLTPIANAPVYSLSAAHVGTEIVGGPVADQESMTREVAEIVLRILRGERVQDIPLQESHPLPMVDWRQLHRWNISESRLPEGTVVVYRAPSAWTLYKWRIIFVATLCLVETVLILALLIHRAKRKRAEKEAIRSRELLQSTIETAAQGILSVDAAGFIVMANAATETMFGWGRGELIGKSVEQLLPPALRERHAVHVLRTLGRRIRKRWAAVRIWWDNGRMGPRFRSKSV